jgi:type VI secretion system secreted protein VgrG
VKGSIVTIDGSMTKINSGPGAPPTPGKAGTAVAPADPEEPEEADKADPGKVAEIKAKQKMERTGKYSGIKAVPFKLKEEEDEDAEEEKSWIEIELKDEEDNPIPGEKYEIEVPGGRKAKGTLDENGYARVEGFEEGECKVTFPNLDKDAWEKK